MYKLPTDDYIFYAVFTINLNGLTGSRVCTLHIDDIGAAGSAGAETLLSLYSYSLQFEKKYLPRIFNPQVPAALHDPTGTKSGVCYISLFQSVHLSCSLGQVTSREEVEWHHYSKGRHIVQFAPEKHVITSKRGLIVNSIAEEDSCRYDCVHHCTIIVAVTSSLVF